MKKANVTIAAVWVIGGALAIGQGIEIKGLGLAHGGQSTLDFHDASGSGIELYEVLRSTDLESWSLVNFCLEDGSLTTVIIPGQRKDREFFRVRKVDQLPGGGGMGSEYSLSDATFPDASVATTEVVELGRLLFWDKELSGNRNISCATCHHTDLATGDGLSLPVGEGGVGSGPLRDTGTGLDAIHERVPRNAPHVFSMGASGITVMFHDGRLFTDATQPSGFHNPAGNNLPSGLVSPLAAQAMFPVTSAAEMAGQAGENDLADLSAAGNLPGLWNALALRLRAIPEYVTLFADAFPDITQASDITYAHAANAIGIYEAAVFRTDNSPFDDYLRGDSDALDANAFAGMKLFYGKAGCAQCHSGTMQTDQEFHAIAMPQIGTGKGHGVNGREDWGRWAVTGQAADKFRFRTPTLRNVELTGPYGHDGAYATLEAVVRHHLDPVASLAGYDESQLILPSRTDLDLIDMEVMNNATTRQAIADANELAPVSLTEAEISDLLAFLNSLTDPDTVDLSAEQPATVPSGLPVAD